MNTPATPSLSILKSDAERLLRDARDGCPDAVIRLVKQGFRRAEELTHDTCLRVVAEEYGTTFVEAVREEKLISRYVQHSEAKGFWREPYGYPFRRARYLRQFDALVESLRDQVPLAVAAQKRGVDFAGFHFSSLLFGRIDQVLKRRKVPDFSHLQAPGSLVHWHWVLDVVKYNHANFSDAKFYTVTADPLTRPGGHFWMADFSYANLSGADFRGSYMRGAKFVGADLDGADFRNANIFETDFTGAQGAYLTGELGDENWDVGPKRVVRAKANRSRFSAEA
ncbi:pentapeptide repeat-containing protein [Pseudomonas brassicacearum]|uniref:pentapeptide repeat-containing protein n=1 Tax=Pseudomonas brassicacearum TaxID=930166 RepID=UPI00087D23C8|nr:pentapeptide repeat-containing protein [Pseudomonas brassicacearum]KAB0528591.1 pentapeptide repeat-containing protein [Pseudomonas brassicacearum subsp. brassicacearum]NJP59189.1 pentapeptide repeat-containing protein [Pseudomonas brassicacearum]SDP18825.1 Pentapeptide repeat-containing protein [Pseudomonas brassicacearum]